MQHAGQEDVLLTDLCAICHVNPLKYTCPRCGIHTCSLPCVKKHKQRAQCSGVRNPAEYRKRSELATPSSVDKDYNFITKIERSLQNADDSVLEKGISLTPARFPPRHGIPRLEQEFTDRGINVIRAPKGLSRHKQNTTYYANDTKCVVWTIEWIFDDNSKTISSEQELKTIYEVCQHSFVKPSKSLKRKRAAESTEVSQCQIMLSKYLKSKNKSHIDKDQNKGNTTATVHQEIPEVTPSEVGIDSIPTTTSPGVGSSTTNSQPVNPPRESKKEPMSNKDDLSPGFNFYLHRPNTEARYKCLIPLQENQTLKEALDNRTILEFPTIYILSTPPDRLQEPYIAEDDYIRRHGDSIPINVGVPADTTHVDVAQDDETLPAGSGVPDTLNEMKVLEVLAKDLGA